MGGRPLIFFRDSKGEIKVWINSCPHRSAMLRRDPKGNARFMTCFYIGWTFSNAGDMVSLPDDAGYGPSYERPSLAKSAKVDSYRGFVFVGFDENVPDLIPYLAGAAEYLDLVCDQSLAGMEVLEGSAVVGHLPRHAQSHAHEFGRVPDAHVVAPLEPAHDRRDVIGGAA